MRFFGLLSAMVLVFAGLCKESRFTGGVYPHPPGGACGLTLWISPLNFVGEGPEVGINQSFTSKDRNCLTTTYTFTITR
jgi:hypothetical protein